MTLCEPIVAGKWWRATEKFVRGYEKELRRAGFGNEVDIILDETSDDHIAAIAWDYILEHFCFEDEYRGTCSWLFQDETGIYETSRKFAI